MLLSLRLLNLLHGYYKVQITNPRQYYISVDPRTQLFKHLEPPDLKLLQTAIYALFESAELQVDVLLLFELPLNKKRVFGFYLFRNVVAGSQLIGE